MSLDDTIHYLKTMENLGIQFNSFIFQLINFGIVLVILNKFLFKPVQDALAKRQGKIDQSLKDAEKIEARVKKVQTEIQEKLDEAAKEANKIIADGRKTAEATASQKLEETQEKIQKMLEQNKQAMAQKETEILESVKSQVGDLAKAATEKVLMEYLSEADRKKITQQALKQISSNVN